MTIGICLSPYGEVNPSGLGVFLLSLTTALIELKTDWHFLLFVKGDVDTARLQAFSNVTVVSVTDSFLWKDVAYYQHKSEVDVWLYLNPNLPFFFTPKKSVFITLDLSLYYDEASLTLAAKAKKSLVKAMQWHAFKRVSHSVCISNATKTDVLKFFPWFDARKISVVMSGFNRICDLPTCELAEQLPETYYLMVGVIKPRKNQLTAVRAFIAAKAQGLAGSLIIVGKGGGDYVKQIDEVIQSSPYAQDIIFKGYVTNEELVTLYKKAYAFVFPSHIEGFGMVIIEAMSCGVPVISSSNSAQGELANGHALTVDANDVQGFTDAMLKLQDEHVRDDLIQKGYARAKDFSWEKAAAGYVSVLEKIHKG